MKYKTKENIYEFLENYGWAILAAIIAIGVLAYFVGYENPCPPLGIKPTLTDFYFKGNIAPSYNVYIAEEESNITEYSLVAFIFETHSERISDSRNETKIIPNLAEEDNVFVNYTIPGVYEEIPEYYEEKITEINLGDLNIIKMYDIKEIDITEKRIEMLNFPDTDFYWEFRHPKREECIIKYKIATYENGEIK